MTAGDGVRVLRGHGAKYSRKEDEAIAALLGNASIATAARACGVAERTLERWLGRPDFQARYREARAAALDQALANLEKGAHLAVAAILKATRCGRADVELRAGQVLLDVVMHRQELELLAARLAALEERISSGGVVLTREGPRRWSA